MPPRRIAVMLRCALPLVLALAACGSGDDGADTASGATATSPAPDPRVADAVDRYERRVRGEVDALIAATTVFTDAVRAGDLRAARAAYAPSRQAWERIEPIAALIEEIDGAVDARVDDFAGPDDPAWTGWHRLERLLWEEGTTAGGAPFADRLDRDLAVLRRESAELEIPPAAMALGAAELIEEVSMGKITGEEDRYSKTDLWDIEANVDGAEAVVDLLVPALEEADPELLGRIETGLAGPRETLRPLRRGDGWVPFCRPEDPYPSRLCPEPTVSRERLNRLTAQLASLSEELAQVPGALGLR